jgi:hypothetical protein
MASPTDHVAIDVASEAKKTDNVIPRGIQIGDDYDRALVQKAVAVRRIMHICWAISRQSVFTQPTLVVVRMLDSGPSVSLLWSCGS